MRKPARQYVVPFHDESGSAVESHSSVFIRSLRRRSTRLSGEKIHLHVTTPTEITENDFCVENVINGSSATIVKTTTPLKKYILLLDTVFHGESSHFYFFLNQVTLRCLRGVDHYKMSYTFPVRATFHESAIANGTIRMVGERTKRRRNEKG